MLDLRLVWLSKFTNTSKYIIDLGFVLVMDLLVLNFLLSVILQQLVVFILPVIKLRFQLGYLIV